MRKLAVYGWSDSTSALLEALREHASLEAVAVGDERPGALIRARTATGLPGFQHVREMARSAAFDTILIGAGSLAADVAEIAAARAADLLLLGAQAEADALARAAVAAARHGVSLAILRPWLHTPAHALIQSRLSAAPPDMLLLEAAEPRPPMRVMRDLIALTTRVLGQRALDVSASETGASIEGAPLTAHLRFAGGHVVLLSARMALAPTFRVLASSASYTLEARTREGATTIEESVAGASAEQVEPPIESVHPLDALRLEVQRVVSQTDIARDAELALVEAAILAAIESALAGAFAEQVELTPRPFQVLRGGRRINGPRGGGTTPVLSLVGR